MLPNFLEKRLKEVFKIIKYAEILNESIVDGTGLRVVAFLQGCTLNCPGCHNPTLQPLEGGTSRSEDEFAHLLLSKTTPLHRGITFSGGEPLLQSESLIKVIEIIKEKMSKLDIWVYTGYLFEDISHLPVIELIDVLVDGPFILEQKDLALPFRGSKNQRIIDVQKSLSQGKVVEYLK